MKIKLFHLMLLDAIAIFLFIIGLNLPHSEFFELIGIIGFILAITIMCLMYIFRIKISKILN